MKRITILMLAINLAFIVNAQVYKGLYTEKGRGQSTYTGKYMDRNEILLDVEIYGNYIIVNGKKIDYFTTVTSGKTTLARGSARKAYKLKLSDEYYVFYMIDSNYNMEVSYFYFNPKTDKVVDVYLFPVTKGNSMPTNNVGSNTGVSSSSYSTSSNSSSQTSTSVSRSSANSWKYRGWYIESTDGIDINTGRRMSEQGGSSSTMKMQITVYDDHLEVATEADVQKGNASIISYYGMENGWRVYRSVSGNGQWRMDQKYYVNSNYDVKYFMNTSEYPIVKEGENITSYQKLSSGSSGNYSSSSQNYSSGSNSSNKVESSSIPRTKCRNCTNGRRVLERSISPTSFGLKTNTKRCNECGKTYDANSTAHFHERCNICHGSGFLD